MNAEQYAYLIDLSNRLKFENAEKRRDEALAVFETARRELDEAEHALGYARIELRKTENA
jgi:hypothetical protein